MEFFFRNTQNDLWNLANAIKNTKKSAIKMLYSIVSNFIVIKFPGFMKFSKLTFHNFNCFIC